mmetsp:Transcript_112535/g.323464  ORF Transcript_112535/g.323464 Transcript_112535/m.323464 type:complete len:221 (+) Transcript_112535:365-1027(+)
MGRPKGTRTEMSCWGSAIGSRSTTVVCNPCNEQLPSVGRDGVVWLSAASRKSQAKPFASSGSFAPRLKAGPSTSASTSGTRSHGVGLAKRPLAPWAAANHAPRCRPKATSQRSFGMRACGPLMQLLCRTTRSMWAPATTRLSPKACQPCPRRHVPLLTRCRANAPRLRCPHRADGNNMLVVSPGDARQEPVARTGVICYGGASTSTPLWHLGVHEGIVSW